MSQLELTHMQTDKQLIACIAHPSTKENVVGQRKIHSAALQQCEQSREDRDNYCITDTQRVDGQ